MITRLNYDKAAKQYLIAAAGIVLCLVIPIIIRKARFLPEWRILYGIIGIVSLAVVVVVGKVSYGAMLGFTVAGINIQPSELVKIVFVFFVASSFKRSTEFKDIVVTTAVAAFHVLILVASKDLGAALIIFVVYLNHSCNKRQFSFSTLFQINANQITKQWQKRNKDFIPDWQADLSPQCDRRPACAACSINSREGTSNF